MTPAPPQLAPPRARIRAILTAILGVVLLAALFLPARDPVTHSLAAEWRPSAELAGVLFLIAMVALVSPRLVARRGFACAGPARGRGGPAQPRRCCNPELARPRPQPLLGSPASAFALRPGPRLGGPVERLGRGRPAGCRSLVGDRRHLLDMAQGAGHPCRPADCYRRRGHAGRRTRHHIVLA